MAEIWTNIKPILEAGVLGAMLILVIRLWMIANKEVRTTMAERIQDEKEHSKDLIKVSSEHNRQMVDLVRQYDSTLTSVNSAMTTMMDRMDGRS